MHTTGSLLSQTCILTHGPFTGPLQTKAVIPFGREETEAEALERMGTKLGNRFANDVGILTSAMDSGGES